MVYRALFSRHVSAQIGEGLNGRFLLGRRDILPKRSETRANPMFLHEVLIDQLTGL